VTVGQRQIIPRDRPDWRRWRFGGSGQGTKSLRDSPLMRALT
jgi:hypothetical protein